MHSFVMQYKSKSRMFACVLQEEEKNTMEILTNNFREILLFIYILKDVYLTV